MSTKTEFVFSLSAKKSNKNESIKGEGYWCSWKTIIVGCSTIFKEKEPQGKTLTDNIYFLITS